MYIKNLFRCSTSWELLRCVNLVEFGGFCIGRMRETVDGRTSSRSYGFFGSQLTWTMGISHEAEQFPKQNP